jgi:hypothetical protein
MAKNHGPLRESLHRVLQRLKREFVEDVDPDLAICEFDCRKDQCLYDEWSTCERRISKAAGELMPPSGGKKAGRGV